MAITDRLIAELVHNFKDREKQAVNGARLLAENSGRVSRALRDIDPELETAVLALAEFVEFQKAIRAKVQAISGHAVEGDDLAASHAHEVANLATLAINLPEVMEAESIGLEEIEADTSEVNDWRIEQVIHNFAVKIRRWRQEHPGKALRVGLVMDGQE